MHSEEKLQNEIEQRRCWQCLANVESFNAEQIESSLEKARRECAEDAAKASIALQAMKYDPMAYGSCLHSNSFYPPKTPPKKYASVDNMTFAQMKVEIEYHRQEEEKGLKNPSPPQHLSYLKSLGKVFIQNVIRYHTHVNGVTMFHSSDEFNHVRHAMGREWKYLFPSDESQTLSCLGEKWYDMFISEILKIK